MKKLILFFSITLVFSQAMAYEPTEKTYVIKNNTRDEVFLVKPNDFHLFFLIDIDSSHEVVKVIKPHDCVELTLSDEHEYDLIGYRESWTTNLFGNPVSIENEVHIQDINLSENNNSTVNGWWYFLGIEKSLVESDFEEKPMCDEDEGQHL